MYCTYENMRKIAAKRTGYNSSILSYDPLTASSITNFNFRSDLDTFPTPAMVGAWPDKVLANRYMWYTFSDESEYKLTLSCYITLVNLDTFPHPAMVGARPDKVLANRYMWYTFSDESEYKTNP
jgi:hypothetical protein